MKEFIFICVYIFQAVALFAQQPNFRWAEQLRVLQPGTNKTSIVDASGNTYLTGTFTGTVDFDPGPGVYNLTSSGEYGLTSGGDMFITKLNAGGELVWVKQVLGKACVTGGLSIEVDNAGNVYTTGTIYSLIAELGAEADFDPGPGVFSIKLSSSSYDAFISKLDACGNFVWAKHFTGSKDDRAIGKSIAIDAQKNVYLLGDFAGKSIDFDPGPKVVNLPSNFDVQRIVVVKLDAAGNFNWAKQMVPIQRGNVIFGAKGNAIAVDGNGNILITGIFVGEIDFDPGSKELILSANTTYGNSYIVKLDPFGNLVWAKQAGKASSSRVYGSSIAVDAAGNVVTAGSFNGLADFDPGPGEYNLENSSIVNQSIYIFKLNEAGEFVWAKQMGDTTMPMDVAITLDAAGNIYAAGNFSGEIDVDPGTGTRFLRAKGVRDVFVAKYDLAGNFIWAENSGGSGASDIYGLSIGVDHGNNVITTGTFLNTIDFDPGSLVRNLSASGVSEIFVHKLSPCNNNTGSSLTVSECYSYTLNCKLYSATGTYIQTLTNAVGCDSIITLNLTILNPIDTVSVETCKPYLWRGRNFTASGFYTDTLKSVNGCDSILSLQLNIHPPSYSTIYPRICAGEDFSGYTRSGTYIDTLMAANGCDSIRTIRLEVVPKPKPDLGADRALCPGDTLVLQPGQFISYQWQDGSSSAGLTIKQLGLYAVTVTDTCGSATDEILVSQGICELYFPSAFTPNSDGKNDLFRMISSNVLSSYSLVVFNRWGQVVFETHDKADGWDGTMHGKLLDTGIYTWYCNFKKMSSPENTIIKGTVLLMR